MSEEVIQVHNVGKRYRIGARQEAYSTLRDTISSTAMAPLTWLKERGRNDRPKEFWALREVSFKVCQGEVLGIIGRNGAGKSTLLKILSRVTYPTEGQVDLSGRVGSLLDVGTGFHAELTGRENIFLSGAILGMKRAEIQSKFDEIVDFAEIEQFLDTPVKRYSSGMYMRLAFAVAAHLEPEILLVDEVLAVGDEAFQKKCLGKIKGIAQESGRTVFFVSHNLQAVQALCDRGLFLSGGQVAFDGVAHETVRFYLEQVRQGTTQRPENNPDRQGDGSVRIVDLHTCDENGIVRQDFVAGQVLMFRFEYLRKRPCSAVSLGFTVYNQLGMACTHINTMNVDFKLDPLAELGQVVCRIPRNPFPVGEYTLSVIVHADDQVADSLPMCLAFRVISSQFFPSKRGQEPDLLYCPVLVDHQWQQHVQILDKTL